ncbi:MAG: hypothetical protein IKT89_03025 [Clostridia bacterium]|nr:hypothetical protein [Clostridia bacterium]
MENTLKALKKIYGCDWTLEMNNSDDAIFMNHDDEPLSFYIKDDEDHYHINFEFEYQGIDYELRIRKTNGYTQDDVVKGVAKLLAEYQRIVEE